MVSEQKISKQFYALTEKISIFDALYCISELTDLSEIEIAENVINNPHCFAPLSDIFDNMKLPDNSESLGPRPGLEIERLHDLVGQLEIIVRDRAARDPWRRAKVDHIAPEFNSRQAAFEQDKASKDERSHLERFRDHQVEIGQRSKPTSSDDRTRAEISSLQTELDVLANKSALAFGRGDVYNGKRLEGAARLIESKLRKLGA